MRMAQDAFGKRLLQEALDPIGAVEVQKPVGPSDPQYSDVFYRPLPNRPPQAQVPHLGVLWLMTVCTCTIEPCSQTLSIADLRGLARKQLSLHHQLCQEAGDHALPVPPQWIISPGLPVSGLAALGATPASGWPPGFYRSIDLLEQWVIVVSELPSTDETRLLRLMGSAEGRHEAMNELAALPEDDPARKPLVVILNEMIYLVTKKAESNVELSAMEKSQMTELRQEFEQFMANLRREGQAEGKALALLAVLAARGVAVNEIVRQKIMACKDVAMLDRLLAQAATTASPSDILSAAAA